MNLVKMTNENTKSNLYPRVAEFYNGKSVLITGAAGFVGMILLEILLRNCPGIEAIYILLREKKGEKPEGRKEKLLQKTIYDQLKEEQPDAPGKIHVVKGDVSLPDLGMSDEDLQKITQNVSIVFHCAAEVSFTKSLKEIVSSNSNGTSNVLELCKKCRDIKVLVYTSSVSSCLNRKSEIEEEVYRLPFPAQQYLDEFKFGTDESLEKLVAECYPPWPVNYGFSKCLSENILQDNGSGIPIVIIRPSLVVTTLKAPQPGFAERNSAMALLSTGVGKGFIRVLLLDADNEVDMVSVDIVGNAHIVAAWKVATNRSPSPFVVNCTSYGALDFTWREYATALLDIMGEHQIPNCFRTAVNPKMVKNKLLYRILSIYEHYVPGYVMDWLLKLSGKKPRLVALYQMFDRAMSSTYFFNTNVWAYDTKHFHGLKDNLDKEDKEMFYTDISEMSLRKFVEDIPTGNDEFNWKKDKRSVEERKKKAYERHLLTVFIQYSFVIIMFIVLYLVISQVSRVTGAF